MLTALAAVFTLWLLSAIIIGGSLYWAVRVADRERREFDARLAETKTRIESGARVTGHRFDGGGKGQA
jgi:hypothetical protein